MRNDIGPLLVTIRRLVDAPEESAGGPLLAKIEHTLTDGYAHALALEAESLRIGRDIGDAVARLGEGEHPETLSALADRLASTERELTHLRALLVRLRGRADAVRRAA
jgi:hypothetical protein